MLAAVVVAMIGQYCPPRAQAYRAPAYSTYRAQAYQTYQAPAYQQTYQQSYQAPAYYPPQDKLYLGYPTEPAAYVGYLAQQARTTAAEQERATLLSDVAAIKKYLTDAAQPKPPEPVLQPPPAPGKSPEPEGPEVAPVAPNPGQPVPPPPMQDRAPPPPPIPAPNPNPAARGGVINAAPAATLSVLSNRCAACHTEGTAKFSGFALFKAPGVVADMDPLDVDYANQRVQAGTMPPRESGGRLPAAERAAFGLWVNENAPAIARALKQARQVAR